jgi:hypothetical protein
MFQAKVPILQYTISCGILQIAEVEITWHFIVAFIVLWPWLAWHSLTWLSAQRLHQCPE